MKLSSFAFSFLLVGRSSAIHLLCSKYTTAVFGEDNADNELALLQAVVNLAVLGDANLTVPGILAPEGGLAPFFDGSTATANRGGDAGIAVNFLDGAGDLPNALTGNTGVLLNHLYQFFGALLGCSAAGFPAYTGDPDMMRVHKFMSITQEQNDFFITQVGKSASALGVTDEDVMDIAAALDTTFNTRCPPPVVASSGLPSFLVGTDPSICQDPSCPLDSNGPCANPETSTPTMTPTEAPTMAPSDIDSGSSSLIGMGTFSFATLAVVYALI